MTRVGAIDIRFNRFNKDSFFKTFVVSNSSSLQNLQNSHTFREILECLSRERYFFYSMLSLEKAMLMGED